MMRHYGNMQWVAFDVQKLTQQPTAAAAAAASSGVVVAAGVPAGVRVAPLQDVMPVDMQWAVDKDAVFMQVSSTS
jgi:hypothetical protein